MVKLEHTVVINGPIEGVGAHLVNAGRLFGTYELAEVADGACFAAPVTAS